MRRKSSLKLVVAEAASPVVTEIPRFAAEPRAVPFYTTKAGIRIGSAYERPRPKFWREDELVQNAFLVPPIAYAQPAGNFIEKVLRAFWRWL